MEDRLEPRDWGEGIPKYKETDLMTPEDIHDFGVEVVAGCLKRDGYKILEYNPTYGVFPSIVAENEDEVVAVIVQSDIAPNIPKLKLTDKFGIMGYCTGFSTKPCFASVSFGSVDPERFDKSIALIGDGFHARFTGLEYISKELPKKGTTDYQVFTLNFVGAYLRSKNYDAVYEFISDDCDINNSISKENIKKHGKDYLKKIFNGRDITSHCVIKSVGIMKTIQVQKLYVEGHSDGKPGTVKIMQDPDRIGLLLVTDIPLFGNNDPGLIFNVDYNSKGKICNINIIDPRLYSFEAYSEE